MLTSGVFLDISKAFDSFNHQTVIFKLQDVGASNLNDLRSAPEKCSVQGYEDDTKLVISFKMKDSLEAFANLRDDLHRIGRWCPNNLLSLNPSKTKLMVFGIR